MTSVRFFPRPSRGSPALAVLLLLAAAGGAEAQSWRAQGAWVAGYVGGVVVGAESRHPLGPEPELPLPGRPGEGPIEMGSRDWILTGMVAAGVNVATPEGEDDVQPLFYAHGGVLYRTASEIVSRVGVVGLFYVPAGAVGPAAFVEAAGVAAVQGGVLYTDRGWRGHAALSLSLRFVCDIVCGGGE